jgi:putative ABC transport system permease protein
MIMLAFLLAVSVALLVMEKWWLQNFAFRVNVSIWILMVSGALVFMLAWLTVSYQSFNAAVINPVDSLKSN